MVVTGKATSPVINPVKAPRIRPAHRGPWSTAPSGFLGPMSFGKSPIDPGVRPFQFKESDRAKALNF